MLWPSGFTLAPHGGLIASSTAPGISQGTQCQIRKPEQLSFLRTGQRCFACLDCPHYKQLKHRFCIEWIQCHIATNFCAIISDVIEAEAGSGGSHAPEAGSGRSHALEAEKENVGSDLAPAQGQDTDIGVEAEVGQGVEVEIERRGLKSLDDSVEV